MEGASLFLFNAAIALYAFFVVSPVILNAISLFGVQKRFAQTMIDEGVVSQADVHQMQPKKQIAGVVISLLVLGLLVDFCNEMAPAGYLCGGLPLLVSFLKYRHILQFNNLTVNRFRNTYKHVMNTEKYNRYVEKHF